MSFHTTPLKLLGNQTLPIHCELAFVCYCPMPDFFNHYTIDIENISNRYFIHTHNNHVKFCRYNNTTFVVIAEVYGGPVSVTTVEELHFYGIKTIIGIGFVGSLSSSLPIGSLIVADDALAETGTTPHYSTKEYISRGMKLDISSVNITSVCVWTNNALYREYPKDIIAARTKRCSVVNMDTSHLYAACNDLHIPCEYYAVVSNILNDGTSSQYEEKLWDAITDQTCDVIASQAFLLEKILQTLVV